MPFRRLGGLLQQASVPHVVPESKAVGVQMDDVSIADRDVDHQLLRRQGAFASVAPATTVRRPPPYDGGALEWKLALSDLLADRDPEIKQPQQFLVFVLERCASLEELAHRTHIALALSAGVPRLLD